MPLSVSLWASVVSSAAVALSAPFAGMACDRYGRKPTMAASRGVQALTIVPCFMWLGATRTLPVLVAVVAFQAVLTAFSAVSGIVTITESCPRHVRATASSIIYGVGVAAFGGSAQVVATWLIGRSGNQLAPAWYLILCIGVSVLPLLWIEETAGKPDRL